MGLSCDAQIVMQLRRPKDLGQQIESFYGLKYLWMNWTIVGMHPPTNLTAIWRFIYYIYGVILTLIAGFGLPVTMLANLWFIDSRQELVANLSLSTTIAVAGLKQFTLWIHLRRLLKSNVFLKPLDERSNHNPQERMNILNAIRYCHLYYAMYTLTYFICAYGFAYIGWSNHRLIYSGWFPRFFDSPRANYLAAFTYQNIAQTTLIFQNGNNDMYPLCYLSLIIGHLDSLAERIKRIGADKKCSIEENVEELRLCILDHKNLLDYFECIRPVISSTLFLQFFITAFALCLTAINLIAFDRDVTEQFFAIFYLIIILFQIFPTCWHVNVLMEKSDYLTTAMYSCNWMDQNQKFRKMLIIFMQRSQKTNTVLAGDLAPVTLQTFLAQMAVMQAKDLGQPLNSANGFKYLWMNWVFVGMHLPPNTKSILWSILYYTYSAVINLLASVCLPASMLANLWLINSWQEVVANLSLTTTIAIAPFKQLAVLVHRRALLKANEFLKPLDERSSHQDRDRRIILNTTHYCHLYYIFYIAIYCFCAIGFAYIGWINDRLVYSGWFPNILTDTRSNYILAFAYQNFAQTCLVFQNANNDVYPLCYLSMVIAHLKTLANRIERIGMDKKKLTPEENIEELKIYFECIRPVISATLFLQFFITGFSLCMTAINLIAFDSDITQKFFASIYLSVILIQIFPTCWHVNTIMEKSDYLTTAMYRCNWMDQNQKFRKMLIIFMQRSQKTNTVLAGNLAPVTLQTFLAIIRFSFSMFTIFSQVQN
ncbi:Odorant receptor 2a [Lucilia cuprina]|nr:Odorant receptor 2a [Lucilia cuprina]